MLILLHVDSSIFNDREISKYATAVTEKRLRKQTRCHGKD
jgi:hypothetical protein